MGLGSFKALGGVYAVAQLVSEYRNGETGALDTSGDAVVADTPAAPKLTFVCASAGNHGLSVAAGARIFESLCRVHIAETVPESFAQRLADKGAEVVRSGETYEDSLAAAEADAKETGAILLADGSWIGHTKPPSLVMEGYTVMAEEMREIFETQGTWPDCVYLQAGVGGFAAAIAYMIRLNWTEQPRIVIIEPEAAPCLLESVRAGHPVRVTGPISEMGRLDCKEPSLLAFEMLKDAADDFVLVSEEEALDAVQFAAGQGMRTTPSGAAGLAAARRASDKRPLAIISEGVV